MFKSILLLLTLCSLSFAAFICPMLCEGKKTYEKAGTCPICHMNLTPEKDAEDETLKPLSSIEYRMELKIQPEDPKPNEEVLLTFTPYLTKDNSLFKDLQGEDKFGLLVDIVSQDLHQMSRLHAEGDKSGSFKLKTKFDQPGNYIVYVRMTPAGRRKQVFPLAIKINGKVPKEVPLKKLPPTTVKLTITPKLQAYKYSHFKFSLSGKHLSKMAKSAQLVVISEDTTWYFEDEKPLLFDKNKATVEFFVRPPKFGNYKIWFNDSAFIATVK